MKALVTGGAGFLGQAIVSRLKARGDEVHSFSRGDYPHLRQKGVETFIGDLSDREAVIKAAQECDIVFHVAAKAGIWGLYHDYFSTNVVGTQNVIAACRTNEIKKLVYTSTPSVVRHDRGLAGVDESMPYADKFEAYYPKTKAMAEKLVLAANGDDLATVALRPHMVWGPGDPNFLPRIIKRRKSGRLRKVSGGPYPVDSTYIDNAVEAHLLAADHLDIGSTPAGKAYFISQGEPMDVGDLIDHILDAAGLPPIDRSIPPWLAKAAGFVFENVYRVLSIQKEPPMTTFLARQLSSPHWFDIGAARRDLNYKPEISLEEGFVRLRESLTGR